MVHMSQRPRLCGGGGECGDLGAGFSRGFRMCVPLGLRGRGCGTGIYAGPGPFGENLRLVLKDVLGISTIHSSGAKGFQPGSLKLSSVGVMPSCGAGLGVVVGLEAFLASAHQMAIAPALFPSATNETISRHCPRSPGRQNCCRTGAPAGPPSWPLQLGVRDTGLPEVTECWLDCRLDSSPPEKIGSRHRRLGQARHLACSRLNPRASGQGPRSVVRSRSEQAE